MVVVLVRSRSEFFDRARTPIGPSAQPDVAQSIGVLALSKNSLLDRTSKLLAGRNKASKTHPSD